MACRVMQGLTIQINTSVTAERFYIQRLVTTLIITITDGLCDVMQCLFCESKLLFSTIPGHWLCYMPCGSICDVNLLNYTNVSENITSINHDDREMSNALN